MITACHFLWFVSSGWQTGHHYIQYIAWNIWIADINACNRALKGTSKWLCSFCLSAANQNHRAVHETSGVSHEQGESCRDGLIAAEMFCSAFLVLRSEKQPLRAAENFPSQCRVSLEASPQLRHWHCRSETTILVRIRSSLTAIVWHFEKIRLLLLQKGFDKEINTIFISVCCGWSRRFFWYVILLHLLVTNNKQNNEI